MIKKKAALKKAKNEISMYFHCQQCISELPKDQSPREFQRIQAGWTKKGLQVWCVRHNLNIVHLDFMGQKVAIA